MRRVGVSVHVDVSVHCSLSCAEYCPLRRALPVFVCSAYGDVCGSVKALDTIPHSGVGDSIHGAVEGRVLENFTWVILSKEVLAVGAGHHPGVGPVWYRTMLLCAYWWPLRPVVVDDARFRVPTDGAHVLV